MATEWTPPASGPSGSGPSGPRASFGLRFAAAFIDAVLVGIVGIVLRLILGPAGVGLNILLGVAYFGYFEGSPSGQTIGKRAVGIRVIDFQNGGSIGFGRAVVRYLMRIVSSLACLVGYFWMLWDKEKQTWHDKVAADVVVPTSAYPVAAWPG